MNWDEYRGYLPAGPEELQWWPEDVRYIYEERLGILTDGWRPITATIEMIARVQARRYNVERISAKWSAESQGAARIGGFRPGSGSA